MHMHCTKSYIHLIFITADILLCSVQHRKNIFRNYFINTLYVKAVNAKFFVLQHCWMLELKICLNFVFLILLLLIYQQMKLTYFTLLLVFIALPLLFLPFIMPGYLLAIISILALKHLIILLIFRK